MFKYITTTFFLLAFCLCIANNCIAYEEAYRFLSTKSQTQLENPVCVFVTDKRPQEQRSGDPDGIWQYTVDNPNNMSPDLGLGVDICQLMEKRGITSTARIALPGETAPEGCIVLNVSLESWYGRVKANSSTTENPTEGHCRFSTNLTVQDKSHDLGTFEGSVAWPQSSDSISEELNKASAIAATQALADFFESFEQQFEKQPLTKCLSGQVEAAAVREKVSTKLKKTEYCRLARSVIRLNKMTYLIDVLFFAILGVVLGLQVGRYRQLADYHEKTKTEKTPRSYIFWYFGSILFIFFCAYLYGKVPNRGQAWPLEDSAIAQLGLGVFVFIPGIATTIVSYKWARKNINFDV